MAKVRIPKGVSVEMAASELRKIGITLGQRLADGRYRAYVRKDHMKQFLSNLQT